MKHVLVSYRTPRKLGWKTIVAWFALAVLIAALTICVIAVLTSSATFQVSD